MRHRGLGALRPAILTLSAVLLCFGCGDERGAAPTPAPGPPASLEDWKAQRARLDETVWADETLAQEYERTLVSLWDALLDAGRRGDAAGKVEILSSIDFAELTLGTPQSADELDHGIEIFELGAPYRTLTPPNWAAFLAELASAQYRLVQSEWHHARFFPPSDEAPARSRVAVVLHVADEGNERRIIVEGELGVEWSARRDERDHPIAAKIDATRLRMLARSGPPPFERILTYARPWPQCSSSSDDQRGPMTTRSANARLGPVLVYDLNRDGLSEVVLVGCGRVLWNRGDGEFRDAPLITHPYVFTETGVIADLNGDAHPDFLSTRARGDVILYLGDENGRFPDPPKQSPRFPRPLRSPSVLTVGDVEGDGDLDVWLAQYKHPYRAGQMPTPYYDANDGYPSYLLVNDGKGNFSLRTDAAGLAEKRFRRTYASSFIDLDDDNDLDLLVVSDYSGIDLYHNDGRGHFVDANGTLRADRHLFGMSASFADYDLDGRLDFFVAGMASTTARRLEALGLGREDRPEMQEMRMRMAFGNRMYLAADGGWREPEFASQVARTGWTWGTTAFDFDNDGDPDIFAANGHVSGESTKDYCVNFWCHDIFDGVSEPNQELGRLFAEKIKGFAAAKASWDGYQKNHLLMNRRGKGFVNVAFLLGVADDFDSRSALSEDLDLDGRVDLVVVEDQRRKGQKLHIYRNQLETGNGWIGVRLREQGKGISPVGASVAVRTAEQRHVGRVVTGETVMGQHSTTLHFGLGGSTAVESIAVRWANGRTRVIRDPERNRYHFVAARGEGRRESETGLR